MYIKRGYQSIRSPPASRARTINAITAAVAAASAATAAVTVTYGREKDSRRKWQVEK